MPLSVQCPSCHAKLSAPDSAAGKRVKCPKCQTPLTVPRHAGVGTPPAPVAAAAPLPPKAAAHPHMSHPAKATEPTTAFKPVQPTPAPVVVVVPPFPEETFPATPPAKAKSGLSVLFVTLAAVAGGGLLLCAGGIAVVAMFFLQSDEPAPAAPHVAVAIAAPNSARIPVESPRGQPAEIVRAASAPVNNITWVAYEDSDKGFKAVFPGGPPQPLDPLESIKDPMQRELVAAFMEEWTLLGVAHGGRKYTLTAAPLELGDVPAEVYLDRMAAGLQALHAGFSLDAQPKADASAPIRDYVLKGAGAGKLLRVVVAGGNVYQLLIEGEAGLAFSDPAAKEFFERFEAGGFSSAEVASADSKPRKSKTKSKTKRRPSEPPPEEVTSAEQRNVEWLKLTGDRHAFTISFPGMLGRAENPLSLATPENRQVQAENWKRDGVAVESYSAQLGERRYGVTLLHDPNLREEGSIRFADQMEGLVYAVATNLYDDVQDRGVQALAPSRKLQRVQTMAMIMRDGRKAIVRTAYLGHFGFVARVEGPADMDDLDPTAHKFLDSLEPPPGAAPLPF